VGLVLEGFLVLVVKDREHLALLPIIEHLLHDNQIIGQQDADPVVELVQADALQDFLVNVVLAEGQVVLDVVHALLLQGR